MRRRYVGSVAAAGALCLALSGCFGPGGSWQLPSFMRPPPPAPATHHYQPSAGGEINNTPPAIENEAARRKHSCAASARSRGTGRRCDSGAARSASSEADRHTGRRPFQGAGSAPARRHGEPNWPRSIATRSAPTAPRLTIRPITFCRLAAGPRPKRTMLRRRASPRRLPYWRPSWCRPRPDLRAVASSRSCV